MQFIKNQIFKTKSYTKLYKQFIVPCIIAAVALFSSVAINFAGAKKSTENYSQTFIKNLAGECETKIKHTVSSLSLFTSSVISNEAKNEDCTLHAFEMNRVEQALSKNYSNIDSMFFFSQNNNSVLYNNTRYDRADFFENEFIYDIYDSTYWKDFKIYNSSTWRILLPVSIKRGENSHMVLPIAVRYSNGAGIGNYLVVNFNLNYIVSTSTASKISQNSEIFVFNKYNNVVFNTNFTPVDTRYNNAFFEKLIQNTSGNFVQRTPKGKCLVNFHSNSSSYNGYTYFSITPYADIYMIILPNIVYSVIISLLLLIMAVVLSLVTANKTALSLNSLFTVLLQRQPHPDENIFDSMKKTSIDLNKQNEDLKKTLPAAHEKYLLDFLNETADYKNNSKIEETLYQTLPFKYNFYAVVVIELAFNTVVYDEFTASECADIEAGLFGVFQTLFSDEFDAFALYPKKDTLCVILNSDADSRGGDIEKIIKTICSILVEDSSRIKIYIGKSNFHQGFQGLKQAYNKAVFSKERLQFSQNKQEPLPEINFIFDNRDETNLFNSLIKLNISEAKAIVKQIDQKNKNANARSKQQLFHCVIYTIRKAMRIKNIPYKSDLLDFEIYESMVNLPIGKMLDQIMDILDYINDYTDKEALAPVESKVKTIINYIDQNFTDPSLSLDYICYKFNLTQSNISSAIKNDIGIGFHEYLTNIRLKEAQRLLTCTDYPIKDICTMSGFGSENTFFRVFKTNLGISPGKYREKYNKI